MSEHPLLVGGGSTWAVGAVFLTFGGKRREIDKGSWLVWRGGVCRGRDDVCEVVAVVLIG